MVAWSCMVTSRGIIIRVGYGGKERKERGELELPSLAVFERAHEYFEGDGLNMACCFFFGFCFVSSIARDFRWSQ